MSPPAARRRGPPRTLVVKVGSALLAAPRSRAYGRLAAAVAALRREQRQVVLVSSGAIALGQTALGLRRRPRRLSVSQAAAAVGQPELMRRWGRALGRHGCAVAQVLLTHADLAHRTRFLNARDALTALLALGVLPVVNENDSVATDEIRVGDNDRLAAQVAACIDAEMLVILTTVDGLYDRDPERHPGARRIAVVDRAEDVLGLAGGAGGSGLGTGGMRTKVLAAMAAGSHGIATVICDGRRPGALAQAAAGAAVGSRFPARGPLAGRKHWIAHTLRAAGRLHVDAGAARALRDAGRSLLAAGIVAVDGTFARGAMVEVVAADGAVARGLCAYGAAEVRAVMGRRSGELPRLLGYAGAPEVVHRDDLVLWPAPPPDAPAPP